MTDTDLETVEDRTYWSHLGSIGIQAVHAEVCKSGSMRLCRGYT